MTEERMHPPDELLAAFAEGKLPRRQVPEVLAHLETCETCMTAIELADEEIAAAPARARTPWLAAAAVAAGIGVASLLVVRPWRSPIDRLVAASPHSARVVEPRLAGGFPWAAYRGPMRANDAAPDPERLRLTGAAADAVERGNKDTSASAQHTAGVARVLIGDSDGAIRSLRAAAERSPGDAKVWSDLAAAEYAAAQRADRASLYPEALGHAEHALRIDPNLAEALFNRALALERLGLATQARDAWERYLAIDPSSQWASEAREHLARLQAAGAAARFDRDQPRLEQAAIDGNAALVRQLVDVHRERARTFGEAEYLGRWAEAVRSGHADEAARWLAVSRAIGDALAELSGETLLRDAVHAVETHGDSLAEAHVLYRRGRIAYSRHQPKEAEPDLRRAAELFRAADDPLSFVARQYAASTHFDQGDVAGAQSELDALARELRAHASYIAAAANVQWESSECRRAAGDWPGAVAALDDAAARFTRLGERSNLASIEIRRAAALDVLGRPDAAWSARIRGLASESREQIADRLALALETASRALMRAGHHDAARAFLALEQQAQEAAHADGLLVYALAREAELDASMGDLDAARAAAEKARAIAERLPDPALRARELAAAELAAGAAELPRDARRAREHLTRAVDGFHAASLFPRVAEASLLRARAELQLGDGNAAVQDLDRGIAALDRLRVPFAGGAAPGVFGAEAELFGAAVRLRLDRGDRPGALTYAERARGATLDVAELQRRLAGSGTAVIESFVDGNEVVTFGISEREVVAAREPLPPAGDRALYDALIRPCARVLDGALRLVIVPDARFASVAYAALSDGSRMLVERMPVAIAPSAASLVRARDGRPLSLASVLAVTTDSVALPEARAEVAEIGALYQQSVAVAPSLAALRDVRADVLHIAAHTGRNASDDPALLLGDERVAWNAIAAAPLHANIVTLSACETLRDPAQSGGRALSLGAGFLAAGAHDVVGTLVPIADTDAHALFRALHQQLAAGVEPSAALRRVQLDARAAGNEAWRALAVSTNRIVSEEERP